MKQLLFATSLALASAFPAVVHAQEATATLMNQEGAEIGTVTFKSTQSGFIVITAEASDIPPGAHGFHIHETGACDAGEGFTSAGGHYAGDKDHGVEHEGGPHPGDLPNVHVGEDGMLNVEFFTDRVSLSEGGENPLRDEDGSAVVIHSGPDDYTSQPSGDAGDRIACGVIE